MNRGQLFFINKRQRRDKPCSLLLILGLLLLSPINALACGLSQDAITPILLKDKVFDYHLSKKTERILVESARLQNGVTVRHEVGGCEHYGFSLEFTDIPENMLNNSNALYPLADQLLRELPVSNDYWINILQQAVQKAATKPLPKDAAIETTLPCGDADCYIQKIGNKLLLRYSFAL